MTQLILQPQPQPTAIFTSQGFLQAIQKQRVPLSFFNSLFKQGIAETLQAELDEHLCYEKYSKEGHHSGNSRGLFIGDP